MFSLVESWLLLKLLVNFRWLLINCWMYCYSWMFIMKIIKRQIMFMHQVRVCNKQSADICTWIRTDRSRTAETSRIASVAIADNSLLGPAGTAASVVGAAPWGIAADCNYRNKTYQYTPTQTTPLTLGPAWRTRINRYEWPCQQDQHDQRIASSA